MESLEHKGIEDSVKKIQTGINALRRDSKDVKKELEKVIEALAEVKSDLDKHIQFDVKNIDSMNEKLTDFGIRVEQISGLLQTLLAGNMHFPVQHRMPPTVIATPSKGKSLIRTGIIAALALIAMIMIYSYFSNEDQVGNLNSIISNTTDTVTDTVKEIKK